MKYLVYALVAALIFWAAYVVIRHCKRAANGTGCSGDCENCARDCSKKPPPS
ncbi:MAG: FeoB-associated Cys-rich membrane protein [Oscillospiraceae bacterium]